MQANCSVNSVNSVGVFTLYKYLCGSVQSVGEYSSASLFCVFREICGSLIKAAWEKFIAEKKLPQNSQNSQKFIVEKRLPQNSRNTQKFIAEKKLPQISQIYTDVSKMFCEFREFCGSKYLCESVQSVGEYSLPVCSVCSVKSVGASLRLRGRSLLLKRKLPRNSRNTQKFIAEKKLPRNSRNTQKFIAEKKLPQISRIYTLSKLFCEFREFCGSKYLCKSVKSVGEYSLPVCSVNSVNSVGVNICVNPCNLWENILCQSVL